MTKQNKAFKFRIYPNKEQKELLAKTFGCVRFVYNKMLAERKETYEKFKDDKEKLKEQKFPTPAKYKDEFPFLKEVDSLALVNARDPFTKCRSESTRLNSSHVAISYAVFCLKKKKKKQRDHDSKRGT